MQKRGKLKSTAAQGQSPHIQRQQKLSELPRPGSKQEEREECHDDHVALKEISADAPDDVTRDVESEDYPKFWVLALPAQTPSYVRRSVKRRKRKVESTDGTHSVDVGGTLVAELASA